MSNQISALQQAIEANRANQKRARELNTRAGKTIFPILSQTEWDERLKPLLAGARCALEIPDVSALLLPPLEDSKVQEVLAGNPDSIKALGIEFQVAYTSGSNPFISLKKEQIELVKSLPDEGIVLPGGRPVEVRFVYDAYWSSSYYGDTNVPALKNKVAGWMNRSAWDNWGKPTLQLPNLETEMFPQILEAVYGTCQLTGAPLKAFGTVVKNSKYWSSDPEFKTQWFQDQAEAEKAHAEARAHFATVCEKAKAEKARLAFWETAVAPLKSEVEKHHSSFSYSDALYNKISGLPYVTSSSSLEELNSYKAQAEKLLEEIKAELVKREEAKKADEWANEVQTFASGLPPAQAYLLITADKKLFVNCGKSSKMGKFEVTPAVGERLFGVDGITPDSSAKESMWQQVPAGKKVIARDFAGNGNLKSKVAFGVLEEQLDFEVEGCFFPGIWAIAEELVDDEQPGEGVICFYPVTFFKGGQRQLPEACLVIDMAEMPEDPAAQADISELLAKWGDKKPQKK